MNEVNIILKKELVQDFAMNSGIFAERSNLLHKSAEYWILYTGFARQVRQQSLNSIILQSSAAVLDIIVNTVTIKIGAVV